MPLVDFQLATGPKKKNKKQTTSARLHLLACTFIYTLVHTYVCIHVKNVNMYALFFSLIPPTADKRTERTDKSVNTQKAHFSQCTLYMYIHVHHTYRCIYVCSFVGDCVNFTARFFPPNTKIYTHS